MFNYIRWSPDGGRFAFTLRSAGALIEVAVLSQRLPACCAVQTVHLDIRRATVMLNRCTGGGLNLKAGLAKALRSMADVLRHESCHSLQ